MCESSRFVVKITPVKSDTLAKEKGPHYVGGPKVHAGVYQLEAILPASMLSNH